MAANDNNITANDNKKIANDNILTQVAKTSENIANSTKKATDSFRQASNDNDKKFASVLKDVNTTFMAYKRGLSQLQDSVEDNADAIQRVSGQVSTSNRILQQSLVIQTMMLNSLRRIEGNGLSGGSGSSNLGGAAIGSIIDGAIINGSKAAIAAILTPEILAATAGAVTMTLLEKFDASGDLFGLMKPLDDYIEKKTGIKLNKGVNQFFGNNDPNAPPDQVNDPYAWAEWNKTHQGEPGSLPVVPSATGMAAASKAANTKDISPLPISNPPKSSNSAFGRGAPVAFLDLVAQGESGSAGYDAVLGSGKYGMPDKPVSQITLDEVLEFGDRLRHDKRNNTNSSALGRYQIVGSTLRSAMKALGLKGSDIYNAAMQDKIATYLARDAGNSPDKLRKVWTSLEKISDEKISSAYRQLSAQPDASPVGNGSDSNPMAAAAMLDSRNTGSPDERQDNKSNSKSGGLGQGINSKLKQIEGSFGGLQVTSGYRSPEHNAKVGGAKNSAHMRGNAVDVKFGGGVPATLKFIEAASKAGIGGIGVYSPGSVHIDTESKRAWGPDYHATSVPQWARQAINSHLNGEWGKYDASAKGQDAEPTGGGGGADTGMATANEASGRSASSRNGYGHSMSPVQKFGRIANVLGNGIGGRTGGILGGLGGLIGGVAGLFDNMEHAEMQDMEPPPQTREISAAAVEEAAARTPRSKKEKEKEHKQLLQDYGASTGRDYYNNENDHAIDQDWLRKLSMYFNDLTSSFKVA